MWISHCKEIWKLTFWALALRWSDGGGYNIAIFTSIIQVLTNTIINNTQKLYWNNSHFKDHMRMMNIKDSKQRYNTNFIVINQINIVAVIAGNFTDCNTSRSCSVVATMFNHDWPCWKYTWVLAHIHFCNALCWFQLVKQLSAVYIFYLHFGLYTLPVLKLHSWLGWSFLARLKEEDKKGLHFWKIICPPKSILFKNLLQ